MGTNNKKKIKSNKNQIENILKYQVKWSQPKFVLIKHSVKDTENGNTNGCNHPPIVSLGKFTSFNYVMHLVAIERNQLEMDGTCWLHKSPVHTSPFCSCWWQIMCLLQRLKTKMPVFFFFEFWNKPHWLLELLWNTHTLEL